MYKSQFLGDTSDPVGVEIYRPCPELETDSEVTEVSAETLVYCPECQQHQPLLISPMARDAVNNNEVWGDMRCGVCHYVIATLTVSAEGQYEFVKVRDIPRDLP